MTELFYTILLRLAIVGLVFAAATRLVGEGALRQSVQIACGLLLLLSLLQPLMQQGKRAFGALASEFTTDYAKIEAENSKTAMQSVGSSIAKAMEYRAAQLGYDCKVIVVMGLDEGGVLQISQVQVMHRLDDEVLAQGLQQVLAKECGLLPEELEMIRQ